MKNQMEKMTAVPLQNDDGETATLYRRACEEDSTALLRSSPPNYYVVPAEWMNTFIALFSTEQSSNWGDEKKSSDELVIKSICNSVLSSLDGDIFWGVALKLGLRHGKDYALVGSNAWKVLSGYGFDIAISRPVVKLQDGYAVEVYQRKRSMGFTFVSLPLSGRWELGSSSDMIDDSESIPDVSSGPMLLLPSSEGTSQDVRVREFGHAEPFSRKKPRQSGRCGLGNLGNTCFMNSTLQCLAHTDPLRQYFLSGAYSEDLNKSNPLGTGGELATEFARLLQEMWSTDCFYDSVVYPRRFKLTLGRHAEQFVGYDQHDSQELATYLLDALHEDTNKVTKKPYIEKPEQNENESDAKAAEKAWQLHLEREDSKVLQAFMGQVKSRVECPMEGCNRVSTTFDPFMYLSVPIPGATDRVISVVFVPLDTNRHMTKIQVTVSCQSTISKLCEKLAHMIGGGISPKDICLVDIWSQEVYNFLPPNDDVSRIRDSDKTYAYELTPVSLLDSDDTTSIENENYLKPMISIQIDFNKEFSEQHKEINGLMY